MGIRAENRQAESLSYMTMRVTVVVCAACVPPGAGVAVTVIV